MKLTNKQRYEEEQRYAELQRQRELQEANVAASRKVTEKLYDGSSILDDLDIDTEILNPKIKFAICVSIAIAFVVSLFVL